MKLIFDVYRLAALAAVMSAWLGFALIFALRPKPPQTTEQAREGKSRVGLALQGVSYALASALARPRFMPSGLSDGWLAVALVALTVALAAVSLWLVATAVRALGKEWSLTARLVEDHRLVTAGPYRFVRHPIYTGMLGMLLAVGVVLSHPLTLLLAVIVFLAGTLVRVRSEERLLRAAFGAEFDVYVRRVRAVLPGIF